MSREMGRDDFVISARSVFLNKGNRQKFSLLTLLIISIVAKKINPRNKELTRKIVHIGTGPVIGLAWWLKIESEIAILFSSIITIALLINYQMQWLTAIEDVNRKSFGTIAYALSITILLVLFWPKYTLSISVGVLSMAFGDGMAGLFICKTIVNEFT